MTSPESVNHKLKSVFITGTDTEVGKTVVTGLLGRFLSDKGYNVITQKWIQTGCKSFPEDIFSHLNFMKRKRSDIRNYLEYVCPYTFKLASSPHLASKLEKRKIRQGKIKNSFSILSKDFDSVLVEGIGGALVPFNNKKMVIDIAGQLHLPVLLVVSNQLGCINHTLLTIEAIRSRGLKLLGLVFNNHHGKEDIITKDNPKIIKTFTKVRIFGHLPWVKDSDGLYKAFNVIGGRILNELKMDVNDG
ncbi:MAG: dethiobiotin synthase [Planctomycetes bacterium]|nr:dethiobiotin synthase [Planctomycetota bacterium]